MNVENVGLLIEAEPGPGVLHGMTGVIARHGGDIGACTIIENSEKRARTYFEVRTPNCAEILDDLRALPIIRSALQVHSMDQIYGKRIIIMGGGAQVGQVAMGAIVEADRHNIRGERI